MRILDVWITSVRLPTLLRAAGCAFAILLAQTYVLSPTVPLALKLIVVAIGILAAFRPTAGLLVVAAVVPFGRVLSSEIFHVETAARFNEAFALAFLAGWLISRFRRGAVERGRWPGSTAAMLFGAMLVASVLVEVGVLRYWKDDWGPYLRSLAVFFGRDYLTLWVDGRPWVGGINGLVAPHAADLFLIGLALMWVVYISCARDAALRRRVVYVSLAAAIGAAVLALHLAGSAWTASGTDLLTVVSDWRIAFHTTKVNAAASHFVLFIPVAGALLYALFNRRRGAGIAARRLENAAVVLGLVLLLAALWMTGSRSALMALIGVLLAALVVLAAPLVRTRLIRRNVGVRNADRGIAAQSAVEKGRGIGWAAAAGVVILALLMYGLYERSGWGARTWPLPLTLETRLMMWKHAADMVATQPLFGVGIGQFRAASWAYVAVDAALRERWGNVGFPAHNHFVQMTAELGLVGGLLFASMFAGILWRAWIAFCRSRDALLGGVIAGLVAFLITALSGSPLAVEVVAYPFWMVLGVAMAAGTRGVGRGFSPGDSQGGGRGFSPGTRWRHRLVVGFLVALAVSVPLRVWQGARDVNYALVDYGLADGWSVTGDDRDFKLVHGEATFFVYGRTYWLDVPVRRDPQAGSTSVNVELLLDGRVARRLTLDNDQWQTVGFMIPPDANRPYRRIDLKVTAQDDIRAKVRLGRHDAKRR